MIRFVAFDLDGTLLDSLPDLTQAVNFGLRQMGLPEKTSQQVRTYIGNGAEILIQKACAPISQPEILRQVRKGFDEYYGAHYCDQSKVYPGISALLQTLLERHIQVAVLSNKPDEFVQVIMDKLFPGYPFGGVMGQSVKFPKKPNPASFHYIRQKLGFSLEESLYVGDSNVDVFLAQNAGVSCVGVTWGYRGRQELEEAGADAVADTAEQLIQLILDKI